MLHISQHHSCVMCISENIYTPKYPQLIKLHITKHSVSGVLNILLCQPFKYLQKLAQTTLFKKHDDKMVQLCIWATMHASRINKWFSKCFTWNLLGNMNNCVILCSSITVQWFIKNGNSDMHGAAICLCCTQVSFIYVCCNSTAEIQIHVNNLQNMM